MLICMTTLAVLAVVLAVWWLVATTTKQTAAISIETATTTSASATNASASAASASASAAATAKHQSQKKLEALLTTFSQSYSNAGISLYDESTGATATLNSSSSITSASPYKLYVAYGILKRVDAGTVRLSDTLSSTGGTYAACMRQMIIVSSNTCGVALGHSIGWVELDTELARIGITHTNLNNANASGELTGSQKTTPNDVMLLLQKLEAGTLLSTSSTSYFEGLLADQTLDYALPTGLDTRLSFAHKTGVLSDVSHDAGILSYEGHRVIVVMMTSGWTDAYSQSIPEFTAFGKLISTYMLDNS